MTAKEFLNNIPRKIDQAENADLNTILHFDFKEEQYTLEVINGVAEVKDGLEGESEITLKASADDFTKIASGDMNPMTAMMFGKLKVSNPAAMMKYAKMLGLM